jgi:hydroxymethylpyrimidine pyrophosphatase-like HAD family hydrolase
MERGNIYFAGELPVTEPSGDTTPYRVTARISLDNGKHWTWLSIPHGDAKIIVKPGNIEPEETRKWSRYTNDVFYGAVMVDMDGTLKFYNYDIPTGIYDIFIEILRKGVPVSISTSRDDGRDIDNFFMEIRNRAGKKGIDIDLGLCSVYLKNGKYAYNAGTKELYYKTLFDNKKKGIARKVFDAQGLLDFIYPDTYHEDEYRITFAFRGGIDRKLFASRLNEKLQESDNDLIALYTDDLFEICSKDGTKAFGLGHFSGLTGLDPENILRIGDQHQKHGIDESMGGFSAYHSNVDNESIINILRMTGKRNAKATVYLLKYLVNNDRFMDPRKLIKTRPLPIDKRIMTHI